MAINFTGLTGGGSGANLTSYTTASITPTANRLVLATVVSSGANTLSDPTLSGCGLTWVLINSIESGDSNSDVRTSVYRAMGASPSAGAVTIDFGAITMSRCNWSITETPDIDTSGTNGSGAIVQSKTAAATSGTAGTADFDNAFGDAVNNATYSAIGNRNSAEAITHEAGYTELHDTGNESQMLETMWRLGEDQTPAPTWTTSARWAQVVVEIKAAASGTINLASTPAGTSTATATLQTLALLRGTTTGASTATGALQTLALLRGVSNGTSTVTGALTVTGAGGIVELAGTIIGVATVAPDIDVIVLFTRAITSTVPRIV